MLTPEQLKWVESRSDKSIHIVPYDDRSERLFNELESEIHQILGNDVLVEHCGASSFKISGQDEIDISVVVNKKDFDAFEAKLQKVFGPVAARYEDRLRFEVRREGKKMDLKMVDRNHPNYLSGRKFESYLRSHSEKLEQYRLLKEQGNGLSVKEYYRQKIEFINDALALS